MAQLRQQQLEDEDEDGLLADDDEARFLNLQFLSHIAVKVRDDVPRAMHVKGCIPYPKAFTGKDMVSTIQALIQRELMLMYGITTNDRRLALQVARSLQSQLWFYDVEYSGQPLCDDVDDLFRFPEDAEESAGLYGEALPTGVNTVLTQCYSITCEEGRRCYSISCPYRLAEAQSEIVLDDDLPSEAPKPVVDDWAERLTRSQLESLTDSERRRQDLIREMIHDEESYVANLEIIEDVYLKGLAQPGIIAADDHEEFLEEVFGNISELRRCNRQLLEMLAIRKRESAPLIQWIGDVFVAVADEFRNEYPVYISHIERAEKRLQEELKSNEAFKAYIDECVELEPDAPPLHTLLHLPSKRLDQYPAMLESVLKVTDRQSPDVDSLNEAIQFLRRVGTVTLLRTIQLNGSKISTSWHELVSPEIKQTVTRQEAKRQSIIFELIQTESDYVHDLELITSLFIRPLCTINPPIIQRERTMEFIQAVFYNINELLEYHRKLLDDLHELQREEHPFIRSISVPMLDAALNWRDAYMEYITHYPIALYHLEEEIVTNPAFKRFVEEAKNHLDARKLDIRSFINRPIPRLLKYELILKNMLQDTPQDHPDQFDLSQVCDILRDLGIASQHGAVASKRKVDLWRYSADLVFNSGDYVDLDLGDKTRTIVHSSQMYLEPRGGSGWREVFIILFDHYILVTAKQADPSGATKYIVKQRPWLLDLVTINNFETEPPVRFNKLSSNSRLVLSPAADRTSTTEDFRMMFPCTIFHKGRVDEKLTLYTDNLSARKEWQQKLEEAIGLRVAVSESDKAFELEPIAAGRFFIPGNISLHTPDDTPIASKITCSVPFALPDGRSLIAIGCSDGVWIGLRREARSLRRVLHIRNVTQCALLPEFGTFLVLADKDLWAYDIESMVPSSAEKQATARPREKLNKRDVFWFRVGHHNNRTLLVFLTKRLLDSVFHVLEPVVATHGLNSPNPSLRHSGTMRGFRGSIIGSNGGRGAEWFRPYTEFQLPCEGYDVYFLNNNFMVVLSARGFEIMIMDGPTCEGIRIPVLNTQADPALASIAKRIDAAKPLGIFRTRSSNLGQAEAEFLLCYNDFGIYINRHGHLSRTGSNGSLVQSSEVFIEWEGAIERVACHPPHVMLFSPRFIEVRLLDSCRIVQVIPGIDVHAIWDDADWAAKANALVGGPVAPGEEGWSPEARVHVALREPGERPQQQVLQVYELLPTLPYVATPL